MDASQCQCFLHAAEKSSRIALSNPSRSGAPFRSKAIELISEGTEVLPDLPAQANRPRVHSRRSCWS